MASNFDQDILWDPNLYALPHHANSIEYPGNYIEAPPNAAFLFDSPPEQTNLIYSREPSADSRTQWPSPSGPWPSIESTPSPRMEQTKPGKRLLLPEPRPQPSRKPRKPPSGEALERRRQQNRAAQLAFRERSKRQMEEMRQELIQCMDVNHRMHESVRGLLERTEDLKRDMEAVLAVKLPTSPYVSKTDLRHGTESGTESAESDCSPAAEERKLAV